MKKLIAILTLIAAFAVVNPVSANETVSCESSQYGGAVCGISTSSETVVEHKTVNAGIADWSLYEIIAFAGVSALVATILYKASYRWYILG